MSHEAIRFGTLKFLSFSLLASGLLSCKGVEPESSQTQIYGGVKTLAGEWMSTVALVSNGRMFCSGTAINPLLVITAAHCVEGNRDPQRIGIYVGEGTEGGRTAPQYKAIKAAYSPKYARKIDGWNDIAYLVLDQPLSLPATAYVPVLTRAEEIDAAFQVGLTSLIVGFGNRNGGGFGVKYEVEVGINSVNANEISLGKDGRDSCQGDSGGPAYTKLPNGEWRVYGVVSRGGACGTGGIYGRMDANICWIQENSGVDLGLAEFCQTAEAAVSSTESAETGA